MLILQIYLPSHPPLLMALLGPLIVICIQDPVCQQC